jgi:hypothetical protein
MRHGQPHHHPSKGNTPSPHCSYTRKKSMLDFGVKCGIWGVVYRVPHQAKNTAVTRTHQRVLFVVILY